MAWSLVFEIVSPVAAMTLYVTLYASSSWVVAAEAHWGLWTWCSTTNNGTTNCSTIIYDDTEGYFEAVRILSTFALIVYISSAYAVLSKGCRSDQRKRNTFPMLAVAAGVLSVAIIGILVENYKEDKAFQQHPDLGLGWCVWLHVVSAALTIMGACLRCYNDKKGLEGISGLQCRPLRSCWDVMQRRRVSEDSTTTTGSAGAKPPSHASVWYLRPRSGAGLSATCQTDTEYLSGLPGYDATSPQYVMPPSALPPYVSPTSPPPPYEIAIVGSSLAPPDYACAARSSSLSNCHDDVGSNVGFDSTVLLRSERHDSVQTGVVICVMSRSSTPF